MISKLASIGRDVIIGKNVQIGDFVHIDNEVIIGDNVQIWHNCVVRKETVLADNVVIGNLSLIEVGATIGAHSIVQACCYITAHSIIGRYVFIGPSVKTTNERHISKFRDTMEQRLVGPTIHDYCRIGAGALIMPGVKIGQNAVIGAGSVITKDVPEAEIWYGIQARSHGIVPKEERL